MTHAYIQTTIYTHMLIYLIQHAFYTQYIQQNLGVEEYTIIIFGNLSS